MADIQLAGRGITITDELRKHANDSMRAALKVFDVTPTGIEMVLRHEKNKGTKANATCEVTVNVPKSTIRVSESAPKMESAIDAATARVSRQLRKYKTRLIDKNKRDRSLTNRASLGRMAPRQLDRMRDGFSSTDQAEEALLVREKHIQAVAMTVDEAMIQCDLLGHDFYLFRDIETDDIRIVYRRNDGGYGLIVAD